MPQHLPALSPLPFPALSCPEFLRTLPCRGCPCPRGRVPALWLSPAALGSVSPRAWMSPLRDLGPGGSSLRSPCPRWGWMELLGRVPPAGIAPPAPSGHSGPPSRVQGGLSGGSEPFSAPGWKTARERLGKVGAQPGWGAGCQGHICAPRGDRDAPARPQCGSAGPRVTTVLSLTLPHPASPPGDTPEPLPDIPPCPESSGMGSGCVTVSPPLQIDPISAQPWALGSRLWCAGCCHLRARAEQGRF